MHIEQTSARHAMTPKSQQLPSFPCTTSQAVTLPLKRSPRFKSEYFVSNCVAFPAARLPLKIEPATGPIGGISDEPLPSDDPLTPSVDPPAPLMGANRLMCQSKRAFFTTSKIPSSWTSNTTPQNSPPPIFLPSLFSRHFWGAPAAPGPLRYLGAASVNGRTSSFERNQRMDLQRRLIKES